MRQTYFTLENKSNKVGTFTAKNATYNLYPNEKIIIKDKPTSYSSNLTFSIAQQELETGILRKIQR